MSLSHKFSRLDTDNAPGQELRRQTVGPSLALRGNLIDGVAVDFSHGDVDAHTPTPGSFELFSEGVYLGATQAYTEYRGDSFIRSDIAGRLAKFTGAPVHARDELIITPGTQGALFLSVAATVSRGDKVAVVQPDYFANRKLVEFFDGEMIPVKLDYFNSTHGKAGLDLNDLEAAFKAGARTFLFSNPNNPTGVVYSSAEIAAIADLAGRYDVTLIVDQLYSRLRYSGTDYTHLRALKTDPAKLITIMGPSKTESLSGYRLGVAFGSEALISRMEKLQAIVSLRAAGYSQAVLRSWFNEPEGWLVNRIAKHQEIRDDLLSVLRSINGAFVRTPEAGSYLFVHLPKLAVSYSDFISILRLQAAVTVTPGFEFSPHSEDSVRLNFSQDHQAAVAAVERLSTLVERYRT